MKKKPVKLTFKVTDVIGCALVIQPMQGKIKYPPFVAFSEDISTTKKRLQDMFNIEMRYYVNNVIDKDAAKAIHELSKLLRQYE
jgi:hypothetical protein